MGDRLAIRADGGPGIGYGHLGRCLAIAEVWSGHGRPVVLVSDSPPELWVRRYTEAGAQVVDPRSDWLDGAAWVVVDGYALAPVQAGAREAGSKVLAVDDFGTAGQHVADLVLDQNLDVDPSIYGDRPADSDLLLGPRFALVRREFRVRRPPAPRGSQPARRLLVSTGGSASTSVAALIRTAVADPRLSALDVDWLHDKPDVAAAMEHCDLALAAAGSTSWELCCMGVPAALFSVAENQVPVAAALASRGVVEYLGAAGDLTADAVSRAVSTLARTGERRAAMSGAGRRVVDGQGPARVEARLAADLLTLRPAKADDCRLLWEWANDPLVRRWAFAQGAIPWETHQAWFTSRIADPNTRIFLGFDGTMPIGQVRFEGDDHAVEISVSVAERARGRGFGAAIVDAAVRRLFGESGVDRVVARLRHGNTASEKLFEAASFDSEGEGSDGPLTWVQYARSRDAESP